MSINTVLGLDPGKSGGIAWITNGKPCAIKMPETLQDLWEVFRDIARENMTRGSGPSCKAYLEQVGVAPSFENAADGKKNRHRMGSRAAFTFGNGFGHLEMALTAAGIPFERVLPRKWQTSLGCLTKGDKNVSKARAQELFPSIKCTHALADSLLIAEYGRRLNL